MSPVIWKTSNGRHVLAVAGSGASIKIHSKSLRPLPRASTGRSNARSTVRIRLSLDPDPSSTPIASLVLAGSSISSWPRVLPPNSVQRAVKADSSRVPRPLSVATTMACRQARPKAMSAICRASSSGCKLRLAQSLWSRWVFSSTSFSAITGTGLWSSCLKLATFALVSGPIMRSAPFWVACRYASRISLAREESVVTRAGRRSGSG